MWQHMAASFWTLVQNNRLQIQHCWIADSMHPFVLFRSRCGPVTHYGSARETSQGAKYPSQDCVLCNSATAHFFYFPLSGVRTFWNSEENLEKRESSNASSSSHRSSELEPRRSKLRPTGHRRTSQLAAKTPICTSHGGGKPPAKVL